MQNENIHKSFVYRNCVCKTYFIKTKKLFVTCVCYLGIYFGAILCVYMCVSNLTSMILCGEFYICINIDFTKYEKAYGY